VRDMSSNSLLCVCVCVSASAPRVCVPFLRAASARGVGVAGAVLPPHPRRVHGQESVPQMERPTPLCCNRARSYQLVCLCVCFECLCVCVSLLSVLRAHCVCEHVCVSMCVCACVYARVCTDLSPNPKVTLFRVFY